MSDNKAIVGEPDRRFVSADEEYEVRYLADKFGVSKLVVRQVIATYGNLRQDVEKHLKTRIKAPGAVVKHKPAAKKQARG